VNLSLIRLPSSNHASRTACLSHASKSSCYQLPRSCDRLTRPLRSSSITSLLRSYESVRPSAPHRYARLAVFAAWASPLTSERLVPAVPRDSLHPLHAPSTPVAVRSVIRHPADSSQENHTPLVSTTLDLTTRLRRVHFRSSLGCSPARVVLALFHQRTPPWLFTTAAAPESRSRGAFPHLSRSLTYSHGRLVHSELLLRVLLQHTMVKNLKRVTIA
jgi:hypothetical protein